MSAPISTRRTAIQQSTLNSPALIVQSTPPSRKNSDHLHMNPWNASNPDKKSISLTYICIDTPMEFARGNAKYTFAEMAAYFPETKSGMITRRFESRTVHCVASSVMRTATAKWLSTILQTAKGGFD